MVITVFFVMRLLHFLALLSNYYELPVAVHGAFDLRMRENTKTDRVTNIGMSCIQYARFWYLCVLMEFNCFHFSYTMWCDPKIFQYLPLPYAEGKLGHFIWIETNICAVPHCTSTTNPSIVMSLTVHTTMSVHWLANLHAHVQNLADLLSVTFQHQWQTY